MTQNLQTFINVHPYLAFICTFVGIPTFMVAAVFAFTAIVTYPIAFICGWL